MLGKPQAWPRPTVRGVAGERIASPDPRRFYARVRVTLEDGAYVARLTGPQGSGVLTSMAYADAYAVLPEGGGAVEAGDPVEIMLANVDAPIPLPHPPPQAGEGIPSSR